MNKLLVNGCSFTAGSGHYGGDNPVSPIVWPNCLKEDVDTVVNLAKGGEGNDRIVRTTMDFCNNNDMSGYSAIIQWSSIFRTEYYSTNEWINVVVNNGMRGSEHWAIDAGNVEDNQTLAYDREMKWLNSINDYSIAFYTNVLTLQNFFESLNIPYMFTSMSSQEHPYMETELYSEIPTTTEINLKRLVDKSKWSRHALSTYNMDNFISQEDRHPNATGNKLIAQALFNELRQKYGR